MLNVSTTYVDNLFQCLTIFWVKFFPWTSNLNFLSLSLKPFPLSYYDQVIHDVSLPPDYKLLLCTRRLPWDLLGASSSPSWTSPAPFTFLPERGAPILISSLWPSCGPAPIVLHFPCAGGSRSQCSTPDGTSWRQSGGRQSIPSLLYLSAWSHLQTCSESTASHCRCHLSWIKILKSTSPRKDTLGTLLDTSLHLDKESLTTTLWLWLSHQFFIHLIVHHSN